MRQLARLHYYMAILVLGLVAIMAYEWAYAEAPIVQVPVVIQASDKDGVAILPVYGPPTTLMCIGTAVTWPKVTCIYATGEAEGPFRIIEEFDTRVVTRIQT